MGMFLEKGKKVEKDFANQISKSFKVSLASEQEDMTEHWDVKMDLKFDVKGLRKIHRSDEKTNENIHWVEIKNVNGDNGWLYGDADYFTFEMEEYWLIVKKESLQDFIAEKCKNKEKCEKPELYKLYKRKDRKDVITLVKTIDLVYISDNLLKKT